MQLSPRPAHRCGMNFTTEIAALMATWCGKVLATNSIVAADDASHGLNQPQPSSRPNGPSRSQPPRLPQLRRFQREGGGPKNVCVALIYCRTDLQSVRWRNPHLPSPVHLLYSIKREARRGMPQMAPESSQCQSTGPAALSRRASPPSLYFPATGNGALDRLGASRWTHRTWTCLHGWRHARDLFSGQEGGLGIRRCRRAMPHVGKVWSDS